jgi:hypothetical protein
VGVLTGGPYDRVEVPPGALCFMSGAIVLGSVIVREDATATIVGNTIGGNIDVRQNALAETNTNTVGGNVMGHKPRHVHVHAGSVRGNIHVIDIEGVGTALWFDFVTMSGNIQLQKGRVGGLVVESNTIETGNIRVEGIVATDPVMWSVRGNQVAQNLQVFRNRGPHPKTVTFNVVRGHVQCFDNDPPFLGGPNTASKAQGQCTAIPLPPGF